jgi:hypothetical protein
MFRQGRVPRGPYFFFFLVAFFFATASPPSVGVLEVPLIGMLVRRPKSVKSKIPYIGVGEAPAPQIWGEHVIDFASGPDVA